MEQTLVPTSTEIRMRILRMAFAAQSVHIPSAFSIVEILKVLHSKFLRYPENSPSAETRDYLILSKGHGVMALYPILASRGWISEASIERYFSNGSLLPGLYEASVPGCEANTGSLGQGVGVSAGLALGAKIKGSSQKIVCVVGDGEMNEGSVFEALSFVGHRKINNFMLVVDLNGLQAMGKTSEVISQSHLASILTGLGFDVIHVDGHSETELNLAFLPFFSGKLSSPLAVVAKTTKGKGLSFMEDNNAWHYGRLDSDSLAAALAEVGGRNA